MQEGIIGLIKAIERFDPDRDVEFRSYAKFFIREAIFRSPELNRAVPRFQYKSYRQIRELTDKMTQEMGRVPTIEEVAEKAELTVKQVGNALDAMYIGFASDLPNAEELSEMYSDKRADQESKTLILDALSQLDERAARILTLYYWEGFSDLEIANKLGLKESNIKKIRQRALIKLRKLLDVKKRTITK